MRYRGWYEPILTIAANGYVHYPLMIVVVAIACDVLGLTM